jgi:hypothetical protein
MSGDDYDRKYKNNKKVYHMIKKNDNFKCNEYSFDEYMKLGPYTDNKLINKIKKNIIPPYVTIDDISERLPYEDKKPIFRTSIHHGQRKLFLNELQFLTKYLESRYDKSYVIYAGAAPCNHIYLLHRLFPNVKFILVDPSPFTIFIDNGDITHRNTKNDRIVYLKTNDNTLNEIPEKKEFKNNEDMLDFIKKGEHKIYILNDLYTTELSELFSSSLSTKNNKIYFWSDIRTKHNDDKKRPDDMDILWNSAQQMIWVKKLKPVGTMLKFRCTYFGEKSQFKSGDELKKYFRKYMDDSVEVASELSGIDFIGNYMNNKFEYFSGTSYIQPWCPVGTTEVRLVFDNADMNKVFDCKEAEEKFYYYNTFDRMIVRHKNKYTDKKNGFDHCNDCSLEAFIWEEYVNKLNDRYPVDKMMRKLTYVLGKGLKTQGHGYLFDEFNEENYKEIYEHFCIRKK